MKFKPHEAIPSLAKESEAQSAYAVLEGQARQFAAKLGSAIEEDESVWTQLRSPDADSLTVYEAVRGLSDHDLEQLETLLIALTFGQGDCQRLDSWDSLFNRVARDLGVDMRNHWRPDRSFLERRTREQLVAIAADCGYVEGAGQVSSYKKADLVNCLIRHFQSAKTAAAPTPAQTKTRAWLPEAMLFPAIDADAPVVTEDEAESVEEVSDED
jgi:ParB family chromosome partitioning protein